MKNLILYNLRIVLSVFFSNTSLKFTFKKSAVKKNKNLSKNTKIINIKTYFTKV